MITAEKLAELSNKLELIRRLFVGHKLIEKGQDRFTLSVQSVNNWLIFLDAKEIAPILKNAIDEVYNDLSMQEVDVDAFLERCNQEFEKSFQSLEGQQIQG